MLNNRGTVEKKWINKNKIKTTKSANTKFIHTKKQDPQIRF